MNNDENVVVTIGAQVGNPSTTIPMPNVTNVITWIPTSNEKTFLFKANLTLRVDTSYEENCNNRT